jgi:hypothetical protein
MPFDRGTITCRVCLLPQALPGDVVKRFADQAAGSLEHVTDEPQWGWVSGRHLLDRRIDDETAFRGGHLYLCLRQAQRKIPASLLRAECRMAELAVQAESKVASLNRKERKRIKEETVQRLLPQMPPQLAGTPFVIDAAAKRLYVGAASDRQMDTFLSLFEDTVGFEPIALTPDLAARTLAEVDPATVPPLNFAPDLPDAAAAAGSLGQNFLTWLWFLQEDSGGVLPKSQLGEFAFLIDGPLVFVAEGPGAFESSLRKGTPTVSAEAKAALTVGKKLKRAKLVLARGKTETWSATIDADSFLLRGLRLPEGEALEEHAAFEERITYLHMFQTLFYALFERYLKEVGSPARLAALLRGAKEWVREREAR